MLLCRFPELRSDFSCCSPVWLYYVINNWRIVHTYTLFQVHKLNDMMTMTLNEADYQKHKEVEYHTQTERMNMAALWWPMAQVLCNSDNGDNGDVVHLRLFDTFALVTHHYVCLAQKRQKSVSQFQLHIIVSTMEYSSPRLPPLSVLVTRLESW
jgi:hypothetical protein